MLLSRCVLCNEFSDGHALCPSCWDKISNQFYDKAFKRCPECYSLVPFENHRCRFCSSHPLSKIFIISPYEGISRKIIEDIKFSGFKRGIPAVAEVFRYHIESLHLEGGVRIVPVPASASGLKRRGFDQMKLIARKIGLPWTPALKRKADIEQKSLSRKDRINEMDKMFSISKEISDCCEKNIILIDDICTTGTTMFSAMDALSLSGKNLIGMAWLGFVHG